MTTNEAERRRWNDEYFASLWPKRERLTDQVTGYLFEVLALRPGERVLDVGCGGGKTSIEAARAVGAEGSVVGADVSAPLNRLARQRAEAAGVGNVEFQVVDVQVDPVEGAPFGVAMSQFGVMFFDEPVTAFANIRAHLEPGARLAFACWQSAERNPWFFSTAIAEFLPAPPEPAPGKSPTGPFALAPEDSVVDDPQLASIGVSEDELPAAQAALHAHMQQFRLESGLCRFPLRFQVFQAWAG